MTPVLSPGPAPAPNSVPTLTAGRALAVAGGLILAIVVLDQASKWLIVEHVMRPPRVLPLTGFFNLVLTHNTGISFGMFRGGEAWTRWVLVAAALGIVAALLVWLRRQPELPNAISVGLICGGAVGNVIDRILVGAVIDFLDFHLGGWHWPAFNVADSAITVGVAVMILDGLFRGRSDSKP